MSATTPLFVQKESTNRAKCFCFAYYILGRRIVFTYYSTHVQLSMEVNDRGYTQGPHKTQDFTPLLRY